jgi:hypothetical protein
VTTPIAIHLPPNRPVTLHLPFKAPADLAGGSYYLIAKVTAATTPADGNTANNTAVIATRGLA